MVGNGKVTVDAVLETIGVVFPYKMVKENTHAIETKIFCPAEFTVDCRRIEGLFLPHFQLVDSRAWNEITTPQPALFCSPCLRFLF